MSEPQAHRSIRIEESAVGSAIVSGDGNTIYVIQQTLEQRREESAAASSAAMGPNPYKGLAAFQERDAARYFGREAQIERLWQRFQDLYEQSATPRFLPILGPSGCGKSSLARAGLIPELARRPLPDKENLRVAVLVPGSRPLEALAGVLAKAATKDPLPVEKAEEFERVLQKPNDAGEYEGLRRIAVQIPGIRETPLVVLVDQFEEVYSLCKDLQQRRAFIGTLLHAASDPTGNVSVIVTLRSDFWGETQRHERLNQIIGSDWSLNVPAMTEAELRRAIAAPAEQAGHPLDNATIALLVKDTEGREGALPLLQFALMRIWDGLNEGKAPAETYQEMGGVGGALAGKAQELYDKLTSTEQEIARRVFVGLVQLGEGTRDTRRRVKVENLRASQDAPDAVKQVLQRFSSPGARLVSLTSKDGQETAEVTHEALFDHWQLLNDWLDENRDDLRFKRRLESAAQYWDEQDRPEGLLWQPPDLELLRNFQQRTSQNMTTLEIAFWKASNQAEKRRKRNRKFIVSGLAVGLVVTSISAGVAILNAREASRKQIEVMAKSASALNASGNSFEALVTALRAGHLLQRNQLVAPNTVNQIKGELLTALLKPHRELNRLENHTIGVQAVRFSQDGNFIATISIRSAEAKLWHVDGNLIHSFSGVRDIRFNSSGETLTTIGPDAVQTWSLSGSPIHSFEIENNSIQEIYFNKDNGNIVTLSDDGVVETFKTDGTPVTSFEVEGEIIDNPNKKVIVTSSANRNIEVWSHKGDVVTEFSPQTGPISEIHLSPNSSTIAAISEKGVVELYSSDEGLIDIIEASDGQARAVRFSASGNMIAIITSKNSVDILKTDATFLTTLKERENPLNLDRIRNVQFSPDGSVIATTFDDTASLWDTNGERITTFEGHRDFIRDLSFSPDGKVIATASHDGTVKLWQRQDHALVTSIKRDKEPRLAKGALTVEFSPDGNMISTTYRDNTANLWTLKGQLIGRIEAETRPMFRNPDDKVRFETHFSPEKGILATIGNSNNKGKLWLLDGESTSPIALLEGHNAALLDIAFSSDGRLIATASEDSTVKLWQPDGALLATLVGHADVINDVEISLDGSLITTASDDGTAKLWQSDGTLISTLSGPTLSPLDEVKISPDNKTIATANRDGVVYLWEQDGTLITEQRHYDILSETGLSWGQTLRVSFSPDGALIASVDAHENTMRLWRRDGDLVALRKTHDQASNLDTSPPSLRFSPDGEMIATAGKDGTIKLWETNGTLITTLDRMKNNLSINDLRFSPDGKIIATASSDGRTHLWPWDLDVLTTYACEQIRGYLTSSPDVVQEDRELCD